MFVLRCLVLICFSIEVWLLYYCFFLRIRLTPRSTRTDTLFSNTTRFRSGGQMRQCRMPRGERHRNGKRGLCDERRKIAESVQGNGKEVTSARDRKSTRLNSSH